MPVTFESRVNARGELEMVTRFASGDLIQTSKKGTNYVHYKNGKFVGVQRGEPVQNRLWDLN
jgi:hypothetical protein